jgi:hypothetical protein
MDRADGLDKRTGGAGLIQRISQVTRELVNGSGRKNAPDPHLNYACFLANSFMKSTSTCTASSGIAL